MIPPGRGRGCARAMLAGALIAGALTAGVLLSGTPLAAQRSLATVTTMQVPKDRTTENVWFADLDGDGSRDLVVATSADGRPYARTLRVHLAKAGRTAFAQKPDLVVPVPRSISACAIGDVHGDAGSEVVWFGARGAYAWRPKATGAGDREVKLVASEFLFQYPDPSNLQSWQAGVRDIDGDGLADLLLPEPDGFRIAVQRRSTAGAATFEESKLLLPRRPPEKQGDAASPIRGSRRGNRFSLGMTLGSRGSRSREPLVTIDDSVPAPQLQDWDGDGDLDVIVKHGERVFVWVQGPGGRFAGPPDVTLPFPMKDAQTRLDPRFSITLTDFDADRRVDAVLVAKAGNSDEMRTQVMFFPHAKRGAAPLFAKGVPGQVLVLAGFTSPPRFQDIDGDGSLDLQINSWQPDASKLATGSPELPIELYVYLNKGGRFSRRPNLSHATTIQGEQLRRGGDRLFARFVGDVTGDRVSDLLVRDEADRLRLHMVRRTAASTLTIVEKPIWELHVAEKARVRHPPDHAAPGARPGFFVLEKSQLLVVRF